MLGRLIDNLIGAFAPGIGARRALARAALRTYQAADKGRRNADWNARNQSADAAIIPDAGVISARARQMLRDSHVAKSIELSKVRNIIGRGITPIPVASDANGTELVALNKAVERAFWHWANDPEKCDVEGRRNFWAMQALAVSEKVAVGEAFFIKSYKPGVGLQLRAYEAEQLNDTIRQYGDNEVRGGIEVDADGKAVAYHFWQKNRNDLLPLRQLQSLRIGRERVLHYFRPGRVMQTRGVSELAPVLQRIRDVHRRDDAELMKAIMEACHGASIIRARKRTGTGAAAGPGLARPAGDTTGETPGGLEKFEYAPGMVFEGETGDEVKFHSPTTPGNSFEPYTRQNLRGIGAGVDLSYEQINRDFSQGTFSSQRQSLLEDQRAWKPEQDHLTDLLVCPVFELWYWFAVIDGQIPLALEEYAADPRRYAEAEYVPDGHDWIDPEKEVNAHEKALALRLTTRKKIIGQRGDRYLKVFDQIKAEREAAAARGIQFTEDKPTPGAAPQLSAPPAPAPTTQALPATIDVMGKTASLPPPVATGDAVVAADGSPEAGVVTDQTLNGAQITAAIDVMRQAAGGQLVAAVAVELLVSLGYPRDKAQSMVDATIANKPAAPPGPPAAAPIQ